MSGGQGRGGGSGSGGNGNGGRGGQLMLYYAELAALLLAAFLIKDRAKHQLACFLVAMPIFHSVVNNSLNDWQYYHIAMFEDFAIITFCYLQYRVIKLCSIFNLLIAISSLLFMLTQVYGWYIVYPKPPIRYNQICALLYAVQILILFIGGGAANELSRLAKDFISGLANHTGRFIHLRNGNGPKCKD